MRTPTFSPGNTQQDDDLNPGQQHTDQIFNGSDSPDMSDFERNYGETADPSQENSNIEKLRNQEANGGANDWNKNTEKSPPSNPNWANNVGNPSASSKSNMNRFKGWMKKASPLLGTTGIVGIGGFAMVALTSPSLLIVQMKEIFTDKYNTQLSSMEMRSNKLLMGKINNTTQNFCGSKVTIKCKYSSISNKQAAKFKAAGIEIVPNEGGVRLPGRVKPDAFIFMGERIEAKEFASRMRGDPNFRSALKQAYNPKYAGFIGKAWSNVAARFKLSKKTPDLGAAKDKEAAKAKMHSIASEGFDSTGNTRLTGVEKSCDAEKTQCVDLTEDEKQTINSTAEEIENSKNGGLDLRNKLATANVKGITSGFKATGAFDSMCQLYGATTMMSYVNRTAKSAQMIRYAMIFFSVADAIKAGESPPPEDVELLGNTATQVLKDPDNPTKTLMGSATDSFAYKNAAYGDYSASEETMNIASRFSAGGGLMGKMALTTETLLAPLGGRAQANKTCGILGNPAVQAGSLVLGVAMLFVPGVNVAKAGTQVAISVAVGSVLAVVPMLLADVINKTFTEGIYGAESGEVLGAGGCALMCDQLAAQSGNAPMTKEDAIAYNTLHAEVTDQYIADELRETSPFDPTSPHTFVGSIVQTLLPLQSSSNPLTTVGSLLSSSVSRIIPKSSAVSTEDYKKSLEICKDIDVKDGGYAADPFCNMIRGIPPKYLDIDPLVVVNKLLEDELINEDGVPAPQLQKFIDDCILVDHPLGYSKPDIGFSESEVKNCVINDNNAYYYLFWMDSKIDSGFDGDYGDTASSSPAPTEGELPTGTAAELAQMILSSGNVVDKTGQLSQIVSGARTNVSPNILSVVASLASSNKFYISSLKRDSALGVGAGNASLHLQGSAVDISGASGVNGVSFGYNGVNPRIMAFLMAAANALPPNCQIGVPNSSYVAAIKPKAKPGCAVFVDTGTAPHIHLGVRGGT